MADTVESLRIELDALRAAFEEFRDYAKPVIDGHQPAPASALDQSSFTMPPAALEFLQKGPPR